MLHSGFSHPGFFGCRKACSQDERRRRNPFLSVFLWFPTIYTSRLSGKAEKKLLSAVNSVLLRLAAGE